MIRLLAILVSRNLGSNLNYASLPILCKIELKHMSLQNRNYSQKLPRLPLPALYDTLEQYVRSCLPFLTKVEYETTKKLAVKLLAAEGVGEKLQVYLENRAKLTENWLADWYINTTYLESRNPLILWSSAVQTLPLQRPFKDEGERLEYAAKVILAALDFKKLIEEGTLKVDTKDNSKFDMQQYTRIFGTNRVPAPKKDCMTYNPGSRHIVVAYRNNFYAVNVLGTDCSRSYPNVEQMQSLLKEIVDNTKRTATPIGLLTGDNRDRWMNARQNLMEHPMNVGSLYLIEKALFLVCLDKEFDGCHDDMTRTAEQLMHGGGVCHNSANRWFDNCIQFVFSMDGINGIVIEQSSIEGKIIAGMADYIAKSIKKDRNRIGTECFPTPKHLCFCYNNEAKNGIETAAKSIESFVENIDIWCFKFNIFGSDFIRAATFSPDSFIQVAIQFAYYRLHSKPGAQFVPGETSRFLHGRTEVVRACSMEVINFVRSMLNENANDIYRMLCLKEAVDYYKQYAQKAMKGKGVDRHLLGLRLAASDMDMEVPELFKDIGFKRSANMKIHTARVHTKYDMFMCIGPLVSDGYGVCYNIHMDSTNIAVTSIKSNKDSNSRKFHEALELSLIDMKDLILRMD